MPPSHFSNIHQFSFLYAAPFPHCRLNELCIAFLQQCIVVELIRIPWCNDHNHIVLLVIFTIARLLMVVFLVLVFRRFGAHFLQTLMKTILEVQTLVKSRWLTTLWSFFHTEFISSVSFTVSCLCTERKADSCADI